MHAISERVSEFTTKSDPSYMPGFCIQRGSEESGRLERVTDYLVAKLAAHFGRAFCFLLVRRQQSMGCPLLHL